MALKYGLIGTGPIGCSFAAHLAKAGNEVVAFSINPESTVALGSTAITVNGVLSASGRLAAVYSGLADFLHAKPDVILIAIKSCNNRALVADLKAAGGIGGAAIVLCQNGMDIETAFAESFPASEILRMVVNMGCRLDSPTDVVMSFAHVNYLSQGERGTALKIAGDLNRAGLRVEVRADLSGEIFKKVVLNSCMGAVCSVTGLAMGPAMAETGIRAIVMDLLHESVGLAGAAGISLPPDFVAYAENYFILGAAHRPSMALDIQNRRPAEVEEHYAALVRLAEKTKFPVPVMKVFYRLMSFLDNARLR